MGAEIRGPVSTVTFIFATPLSLTLKLIHLDPLPGRSEGRVQGQPVRSVLIERGANGLWRIGSRRGEPGPMTSSENYPGEPGLGFVEETSGSEAEERRPRETRPDRVTASAGDRQIGVRRLQPDLNDMDEPLLASRRRSPWSMSSRTSRSPSTGDDLWPVRSRREPDLHDLRPKAA